MRLSVYFSEDAIHVLLGKRGRTVKVIACQILPLKPGTLINDVVTEDDQLKEVLMKIRDQYPKYRDKVRLVLGNSRILTKTMQVPALPARHILEIAKRELQTCFNISEDMVYDYTTLKTRNSDNKGGTILAVAVKRELIDSFTKLFQECGMELREADIALNAILGLTRSMRYLEKETYILSVLDGRSILSFVFIEGDYMYSNRFRLTMGEEGPETGLELSIHLSSLLQFNRSQRNEKEIKKIYLCGVRKERESASIAFLQAEIGKDVEISILDGPETYHAVQGIDYRLCDYPFATGTLCRKR